LFISAHEGAVDRQAAAATAAHGAMRGMLRHSRDVSPRMQQRMCQRGTTAAGSARAPTSGGPRAPVRYHRP
jgi:hypothetical protein